MRKIFTLFTALLCVTLVLGQSQTASPTTLTQTGTGTPFVGTATFVATNDNLTYLTSPLPRSGATQVLLLTGFGFSLPENAIISGVEVSVDRRAATADRISPTLVQLAVGGAPTGENKSGLTGPLSNNDVLQTYGSENDKFGITSLSREQVNSPDFGIALQFQNSNANNNNPNTVSIDFVSITVYYSVGAALPVTFISFTANQQPSGTLLIWKVAEQVDVEGYEVQKSMDGNLFNKIGYVAATDVTTYNFTDRHVNSGTVYYRIRNIDVDGKFKYSTVITIRNGVSATVFKAFPIPARNNVTLQHEAASSNTMIRISTQDGRNVKVIRPSEGSIQSQIDISNFPSGLYLLQYSDGARKAQALKLIKQ